MRNLLKALAGNLGIAQKCVHHTAVIHRPAHSNAVRKEVSSSPIQPLPTTSKQLLNMTDAMIIDGTTIAKYDVLLVQLTSFA